MTISPPLNFVSNEAAHELGPLARERNVGFIAMKPFVGGRIREANLAIKYLLQFDNVVPDPGIEKAEEIDSTSPLSLLQPPNTTFGRSSRPHLEV